MQIKLTDEQMKAVTYKEDFIVNGEMWRYIEQDGSTEDEGGRYKYYIYQRPSDSKYFKIMIALCRYGYEDYGYEDWM